MNPKLAVLVLVALLATACSAGGGSTDRASAPAPASAEASTPIQPTYTTAEQIAANIRNNGIEASDPTQAAEPGYIEEVGGTSYELSIGTGNERQDGINMFPNPESLAMWVELSKSFGGVAVTGDVWAVSLETDSGFREDSLLLAPRIADALGGTVQK
jgi:hypothetical protein